MATWHIVMLVAFLSAPAAPPQTYRCGKAIEQLAWSHDSRKLAFGDPVQACVLDVASRQVARLPLGTFYAWRPGKRQFVMEAWYREGEHKKARLSVVDVDDMREVASRRLTEPVSVAAPLSTGYATDGALIVRTSAATQAAVFMADTLLPVPLPHSPANCYDLAGYWQPGSHRLLMLSDCLGNPFPSDQRMSVIDVDTSASVREIAKWHNVNMTDRDYTWSPDGALFVLPLMTKHDQTIVGVAAYHADGTLVYRTDIVKARSKRDTGPQSDDWRYTFNPSGSLLAIDTGDARSAIIDAHTGAVVLPYGPVGNYEHGFDWLSDDVLLTTEPDTASLSLVDARTGRKTSLPLPRPVAAFETTVSPDKAHVAFCDERAAFVIRLADGNTVATAPADVRSIAWSPDGRLVAFNGDKVVTLISLAQEGE